jgi:hypothetical protein
MDAKAKAQAVDAFEHARRTLKKHQRETREMLAVLTRAQVGLLDGEDRVRALGIEVQTTQSSGGHSGNQNTQAA